MDSGANLVATDSFDIAGSVSLGDGTASFDLGAIDFAGPLVIATMMMLFARGSKSKPLPWFVSGGVALLLFEAGAANYLILLGSVMSGMIVAIWQTRRELVATARHNDGDNDEDNDG